MFKFAKLSMTLLCALALSTSAFAAEDDVFLDEGNGDFDSMPIPAAPVAEKEVPPPNPQQAPEPSVEDSVPTLVEDTSAPVAEEPVAEVAKPVKAKKAKAAKATQPKSSKASGSFATTKEACPMLRAPASTSETMLTVKPAKKIWVEAAGEGWVKGFNKAGEPGYISRSCFE